MPLTDARELSDSAVRLARQTWAAPAGGDPVKAAACEEADDVDQLVLGEDVVRLLLYLRLLHEPAPETDMLHDSMRALVPDLTITLKLLIISFLVKSMPEQGPLAMSSTMAMGSTQWQSAKQLAGKYDHTTNVTALMEAAVSDHVERTIICDNICASSLTATKLYVITSCSRSSAPASALAAATSASYRKGGQLLEASD